jgi:flagellin-like protein
MKKLLKSKKALSPVVAAIILIAVTVAVSIAVAAWMGALTFTFMSTEQLEVQSCTFNPGNTNVTMSVQNTGSADLTISRYKIGTAGSPTDLASPVNVAQGASGSADVPLAWTSGTTYDIYLITATGKQFPYRATAP